MIVETVPISSLILDPANARKHGAKNIEAIKGSLVKFGQVEPLVVQKSTGIVIGGNGRLVAMKELGFEAVDIVEVDLDPTKSSALALALNRAGELAGWDFDILGDALAALKADDFDIEAIGFDEADWKLMQPLKMGDMESQGDDDGEEGDLPEGKPVNHSLTVSFETDDDKRKLFTELRDRGYKVKA